MALKSVFQHVAKGCNSPLLVLAAKNSTRDYSSRFVNRIELLGRIGTEPLRVGENNAVTFPFYTENIAKRADGTLKTYPEWHRVLVPRRGLADAVYESVDRGQRCFVVGRIAYKAPEVDEIGKTNFRHEAVIICDQIVFLEKSRKSTDNTTDTAAEDPKEAILN